jgi:hypothetical protein
MYVCMYVCMYAYIQAYILTQSEALIKHPRFLHKDMHLHLYINTCIYTYIHANTFMYSEAASTAFQNLYDNVDGLLDAWAAYWAEIARTFQGDKHVLGSVCGCVWACVRACCCMSEYMPACCMWTFSAGKYVVCMCIGVCCLKKTETAWPHVLGGVCGVCVYVCMCVCVPSLFMECIL